MIETRVQLQECFEEYILQFPPQVIDAVTERLSKKGARADALVAERMMYFGVELSNELKQEIFGSDTPESFNTGLGSTPDSELRKYNNRKKSRIKMINTRKSMSAR